jgi:hypothetical protein
MHYSVIIFALNICLHSACFSMEFNGVPIQKDEDSGTHYVSAKQLLAHETEQKQRYSLVPITQNRTFFADFVKRRDLAHQYATLLAAQEHNLDTILDLRHARTKTMHAAPKIRYFFYSLNATERADLLNAADVFAQISQNGYLASILIRALFPQELVKDTIAPEVCAGIFRYARFSKTMPATPLLDKKALEQCIPFFSPEGHLVTVLKKDPMHPARYTTLIHKAKKANDDADTHSIVRRTIVAVPHTSIDSYAYMLHQIISHGDITKISARQERQLYANLQSVSENGRIDMQHKTVNGNIICLFNNHKLAIVDPKMLTVQSFSNTTYHEAVTDAIYGSKLGGVLACCVNKSEFYVPRPANPKVRVIGIDDSGNRTFQTVVDQSFSTSYMSKLVQRVNGSVCILQQKDHHETTPSVVHLYNPDGSLRKKETLCRRVEFLEPYTINNNTLLCWSRKENALYGVDLHTFQEIKIDTNISPSPFMQGQRFIMNMMHENIIVVDEYTGLCKIYDYNGDQLQAMRLSRAEYPLLTSLYFTYLKGRTTKTHNYLTAYTLKQKERKNSNLAKALFFAAPRSDLHALYDFLVHCRGQEKTKYTLNVEEEQIFNRMPPSVRLGLEKKVIRKRPVQSSKET